METHNFMDVPPCPESARRIKQSSKEACAPSAHSNQPEADKSPAQKPAGKSHPDQPSKMKTATYQWPFLFHGDAKMNKVEKRL